MLNRFLVVEANECICIDNPCLFDFTIFLKKSLKIFLSCCFGETFYVNLWIWFCHQQIKYYNRENENKFKNFNVNKYLMIDFLCYNLYSYNFIKGSWQIYLKISIFRILCICLLNLTFPTCIKKDHLVN